MANNTKQQAINTFTGGLNTDLHPLTTPNDILTDCINGTVITYNGNEYILQMIWVIISWIKLNYMQIIFPLELRSMEILYT